MTSWSDDALCKGKDTRHWFPLPIGSVYLSGSKAGQPGDPYAYARSICAECPVRAACLDDALAAQRYGRATGGMWGGLDEVERRDLLRTNKPGRKPPTHGTPAGYKQHGRLGERACGPCLEANRASRGYSASKVAS